MVAGKVKRTMWERLRRIVRSHHLTHMIALNAYRRYHNPKIKREFHLRINRINPYEYLDISHKPHLNVIILVVDSLRNSRLSCQGYLRQTTPFLDSLKSRFTAISASSWTYPSVASILTGLYPHNHNAVLAGKTKDWRKYESYVKLRGEILALPEMLFFLGYRIYFGTAISLAYDALRARVIPKQYDCFTRADDLLNDLRRWIAKEKGEKLLAYVHLGDLHMPLNPPDNFRNFFGDVKDLPGINFRNSNNPQDQKSTDEKLQEYRENVELLYDNTLRYVDCAIERLFHFVEDAGLADRTILVVTADHGDEFLEHAEIEARSFYDQRGCYGIGHGHSVFNEIIQVPLLMSGPIPTMGSTHFVSAVDIVPTVVDLLGISHDMRFDGQNIFETEGERPLLSEASAFGYEKKALVIGRYKLIYSKDDGIEWLFDLENDPQEQHPIVNREVTSVFVEKLLQMLKEDEKRRIREIARKKSSLKALTI